MAKEKSKYNKTQLNIAKNQERMIIHRDSMAHLNRFGYVLNHIRWDGLDNKKVILDVGSGNRQLAMAIYTNKYARYMEHYHSVDLRPDKAEDKFNFPNTHHVTDVTEPLPSVDPDYIVNFEVIEHMPKESGIQLLDKIVEAASEKTEIFLSTPCYNGKKLPANHIYEWEYQELKDELETRFEIIEHFGTFMNTLKMEDALEAFIPRETLTELRKFHSLDVLSSTFAPLVPAGSRNCVWRMKLK